MKCLPFRFLVHFVRIIYFFKFFPVMSTLSFHFLFCLIDKHKESLINFFVRIFSFVLISGNFCLDFHYLPVWIFSFLLHRPLLLVSLFIHSYHYSPIYSDFSPVYSDFDLCDCWYTFSIWVVSYTRRKILILTKRF